MGMQDYFNLFFLFTAGAFWGAMYAANHQVIKSRIFGKRKMDKMIEALKAEAERLEKENSAKTTAVLTYRSTSGKLETVKITIDPSADTLFSQDTLKALVAGGHGGMLQDALSGDKETAQKMNDTEEFVFSSKSAALMRSMGMEPEEVVTQILKATGKMA